MGSQSRLNTSLQEVLKGTMMSPLLTSLLIVRLSHVLSQAFREYEPC